MKTDKLYSTFGLFCLVILFSCSKEQVSVTNQETVKFMVISDIHYFDPVLFALPANTELKAYLASDRKMVIESSAILENVLKEVVAQKPDFLLISGDLTKDGEKINHQALAIILKSLTEKGIKVLVIPGNHDINNSNSYSYLQAAKTRIETINSMEFASVYKDCGYGDVLERDPNSLSYVSEPVSGIWVLGIDACHYYPVRETAGSISDGTLSWIKSVAGKAKKENKILISMMHHGLTEHFKDQNTLFPGYVVSDWQNTSSILADMGLKVIFTGHFHAQDIVKNISNSGFIFDIETGSTVTFPSAYRIVTLRTKDNQMKIETGYIKDVTFSTIPQEMNFQTYSKSLLNIGIKDVVYQKLSSPPYNISGNTITTYGLDRIFMNAVVSHFSGDEIPTVNDLADMQLVKMASQSLGDALQNVWTDLAPADNNITIDLNNGIVK